MSPGSIVLGVVLLGVLVVAVAWPWLRPLRQHRVRTAPVRIGVGVANPRQEYQALVAAIRDLDFDYHAGVVTEEDYRILRNDLALRAATLLQALDRHPDQESNLEAQVEAMVDALRAQRRRSSAAPPDGAQVVSCTECGHLGRPGDRFCARCGAQLPASPPDGPLACPDCGTSVEAEDRFCAGCGRLLVKEVAVTP
jgi:DNA-directed RNA polymerase subunit RPC12/RpoP